MVLLLPKLLIWPISNAMQNQKASTPSHLPFWLLFTIPLVIATTIDEASHLTTYIVYVKYPEGTVFTSSDDCQSWYESFLPVTIASSTEPSRMVYTYNNVANAFAARLTNLELQAMAEKEGFLYAYPDRMYFTRTTHTPNFLGLSMNGRVWNLSNYGEGVIIGVLDGGVLPTHPSFSGDGMPPPPAKWKGRCDFKPSECNNKLIGARNFLHGANAMKGRAPVALPGPPLDVDGHGTHVASTAAGAPVEGAQMLGNAEGVAIGVAPKAHLAIYKVCEDDACPLSDILAGLDAAVSDGIDVLSVSLGGDSLPYYKDLIAVGTFALMEKGVFVSCAGGNTGPNASTISNEAPWMLTVAASTMDREIRATVKLGNGLELDGESLYQPKNFSPASYPLIYPGAGASGVPGAPFCGNGSLDVLDVRGKIVLCDRGGGIGRVPKGELVKKAGGIAMILVNRAEDGYSTMADLHVLPASNVAYSDGLKIKAYINSTAYPTAAIVFKGTVLGTSPAPAITSFSSRGPSIQSPGILRPDITGPGVSVLAAWPFSLEQPYNTSPAFNIISGTSMSTPHLSGIAALVKAVHPDWSPAAIKSAIMTTADILDHNGKPIVDEQLLPADLFATGAGHPNPEKAIDPGLVYDLGSKDYIAYLCGLGCTSDQVGAITRRHIDCSSVKAITEGELNYPSISVLLGANSSSVTYERTVKNVGEEKSTYRAEVDSPVGVLVRVNPNRLRFTNVNQERKFTVKFTAQNVSGMGVSGGYLKWVSHKRTVRSPISVTHAR